MTQNTMAGYMIGFLAGSILTANMISGCDLRESKKELKDKELERIVISGSKVYSVNVAKQTNYFKYNGEYFIPVMNEREAKK